MKLKNYYSYIEGTLNAMFSAFEIKNPTLVNCHDAWFVACMQRKGETQFNTLEGSNKVCIISKPNKYALDLYPDNCNDDHLNTIFHKYLKENKHLFES